MMRHRLILFLFMLLAGSASAQSPTNRITLTITITNVPVTSNTLVVNASTRTWTNASSATTILTNLVNTSRSATNLYNQIASNPYGGGIFPRWLSETSLAVVAPLGAALSASQSGAWAILTLSTQSAPQTFTALWPIENLPTATNRTNQASSFVGGLSQFSTNAFATNSTAGSNFLTKGASPLQRIAGPITFGGQVGTTISSQTNVSTYNSTNRGYLVAFTNGYWTNGILGSPIMTNGANYGSAFRSPGNYPNSDQFGSGASVGGGNSIAAGPSAAALTNGTAVGYLSSAGTNGVAIGAGADASGAFSSVAIGQNSAAQGSNGLALGQGTVASHAFSTALGYGAATTTNAQIVLGSSTATILVPGLVTISGSQSNTTFTGTNVLNGRLDFKSRANAALVNGANSAIVLGTNVYVRLSGATTVAGISGFAAEQDGSFHIVQFSGAITNVIVNRANSTDIATDATAANRIEVGTGTNFYATNSPLVIPFVYDGTAGYWRMLNFLR